MKQHVKTILSLNHLFNNKLDQSCLRWRYTFLESNKLIYRFHGLLSTKWEGSKFALLLKILLITDKSQSDWNGWLTHLNNVCVLFQYMNWFDSLRNVPNPCDLTDKLVVQVYGSSIGLSCSSMLHGQLMIWNIFNYSHSFNLDRFSSSLWYEHQTVIFYGQWIFYY